MGNKRKPWMEGVLTGKFGNGYSVKDAAEASAAAIAIAGRESLSLLAGTGNPTATPHIQYTQPWPGFWLLDFYPEGDLGGKRSTKQIGLVIEA